MDVSKFLQGDHLTAADVDPMGSLCKVEGVSTATFDSTEGGKVEKVVLVTNRGKVVLNKTNLTVIADAYGRNAQDWVGQPVKLFREKVNFAGRMVDAIRIKCATAKVATKQVRPAPDPVEDIDIPF